MDSRKRAWALPETVGQAFGLARFAFSLFSF
jgi:hypothetical protein